MTNPMLLLNKATEMQFNNFKHPPTNFMSVCACASIHMHVHVYMCALLPPDVHTHERMCVLKSVISVG